MKKATIREIAFYALAGLVLLLMAYVTVAVMTKEIPAGNVQSANIMLGVVLGWGSAVVFYFFGSSKGSSDKSEQIYDKKNDTTTQG